MAFDSLDYLSDYYNNGQYPKIHNNIMEVLKELPPMSVMDIGCCTGLLSKRLSEVHTEVIGIEPNPKYIQIGVKSDNIKYYNIGVNKETLPVLKELIKMHNIKCCVMRRCLPEICNTGGISLCVQWIYLLYKLNVEYLAIEGRVVSKRASNALYSIEKEVELCLGMYDVIKSYRACRLLKIQKHE